MSFFEIEDATTSLLVTWEMQVVNPVSRVSISVDPSQSPKPDTNLALQDRP